MRDGLQAEPEGAAKRAKRARGFEHDADQLVVSAREAVRRRPDYAVFLRLLQTADDAADELEDAVFLIGLDALEGKPLEALQSLPICWWRRRRNGSRRWVMRARSAAPRATPRPRIS